MAAESWTPAGTQADARGVDEDAVALALLDHLGIAGDDLDAGGLGGACAMDSAMRASTSMAEPFFQDERGAQEKRLGAAHREIVDRAVHGERADVAAAERRAA